MKSFIDHLKNSAYESLVSKEASPRVPQSVLNMCNDDFRECYEYCYRRMLILHQNPMSIDLRKKNNYLFKYEHLLPLEYYLSAHLTDDKKKEIASILRQRLERVYPYDDVPPDTELVFFSKMDVSETEAQIHHSNDHLSPRVFERLPDADWDCTALSKLAHIATEDNVFHVHPDAPWDWTALSKLAHIATEDNVFHVHPDAPWDWTVLTMAKDTIGTAENIFEKYPEKPWDVHVVNTRRDLVTRRNVFEKYPQSHLWDFATLLQHVDILFDADDEEEWKKKKAAVDIIENKWLHCFLDPHYLVCKRRLLREFHEMEKDLIS